MSIVNACVTVTMRHFAAQQSAGLRERFWNHRVLGCVGPFADRRRSRRLRVSF